MNDQFRLRSEESITGHQREDEVALTQRVDALTRTAFEASQCDRNRSLFTRLLFDVDPQPKEREAWTQILEEHGIRWLGQSIDSPQAELAKPRQRVEPIRIDGAIDVAQVQGAAAIELQLYGQPFGKKPKSNRSHWCSNLPIEVFDLEQLAKKIQLLKFLTDDTREVGATIGPLKIYEDVRFLADSGLDYVCILESVYHRLDPAGALCLSRGSSNIETALKAAKDSGTRVRIQFAGSATTSEDIHDCFRGGVAAVCIDGYLAARALGTQTNDSLGSFLGYATPTPSQTLWIRKELEQLTAELEDWDAFFHRRSFA